jgi:hypothetical protein
MPRTQEASWKNNKQSQSNSDQFFVFFRSMAIAKSEYQESLDIMLLGRRRGITENGRRGSFPIVSSLSLYRKLYFLFVLNYSCLECKDSAPTNKQKRFSSIAFRTDVIFESPTKLFDWPFNSIVELYNEEYRQYLLDFRYDRTVRSCVIKSC